MSIRQPTQAEIIEAASRLRAGKLVAFPTETVYGLGADALNEKAVAAIFAVKRRPTSSPIIVHVDGVEMARLVAAEWPDAAQALVQRFWPGPLTLVLRKQPEVPSLVTAGLDTVGVRMPAHPVALALINAAQIAIAAPSANRFTQLSPTTAKHVRESLGEQVDYILDGGACTVGIESTVLSLAEGSAILLRPGGISIEQIEEVIGPVTRAGENVGHAHPSPGMHPRHYSPRTKLVLARDGRVPEYGSGVYLQLQHSPSGRVRETVVMPPDPAAYSAKLYAVLHDLDDRNYDWIAVDMPDDRPAWEAVRDRLTRAATPSTKDPSQVSAC